MTLVQVALWLPLLILLMSMAIDVGNWFVHRRHLQMQADAAALAAAQHALGGGATCNNETVYATAKQYGGIDDPESDAVVYNQQIGGTPAEKVGINFNQEWWPNPDSSDGDGLRNDEGAPHDGTVDMRPPCESGMVDVKLTEKDLPWFFRIANVPYIGGHARVELRKANRTRAPLPVAALDVNPKTVEAHFINESTGEILGRTLLSKGDLQGDKVMWSSATPAHVPIKSEHIGVEIAMSNRDATSLTCSDGGVTCYDLSSTDADELLHIRGWSNAGTGAKARDVRLDMVGTADGCEDPYFTKVGDCKVKMIADLDFGSLAPSAVTASVQVGSGRSRYALEWNATTSRWESKSTALIPIPAKSGGVPLTIHWQDKSCKGGNCDKTFNNVQRSFSAATLRSGPIQSAQVAEGGTFWTNSFERCADPNAADLSNCTHDLTVTIGLLPTLEVAQGVDDPVQDLRIQVEDGDLVQSLNCDPTRDFFTQMLRGCRYSYTRNEGIACPSASELENSWPQPWPCSAVWSGNKTNQMTKALNQRILGPPDASGAWTDCTNPNKWETYWRDDGTLDTEAMATDPRVVQLFIANYGSFTDNHGVDDTVPIIDFAYFYITGWAGQGGGGSNPCAAPDGGDDPRPGTDSYIWGHFVEYIPGLDAGVGEDEPCDLGGAPTTCVSVLTE